MIITNDFVSKLISPMLCKEDAKFYNQAKRLLAIAETYGSELLKVFMLKYVKSEKLREQIANMITRRLVWLYPDHGFAIRRSELKLNNSPASRERQGCFLKPLASNIF